MYLQLTGSKPQRVDLVRTRINDQKEGVLIDPNPVCPRLLYFKESSLFHDFARSPLFPPFFRQISFLDKKEIGCFFIFLFPHN